MKYMGSKRWMLGNGLGHLLDVTVPNAGRFVDLFSGSAAVATFVATRHRSEVHSADLQTYSRVLSAAILERTSPLLGDRIWSKWEHAATTMRRGIRSVPGDSALTQRSVTEMRDWCARRRHLIITRAYGGHYFSAEQAVWLDALRMSIPRSLPQRTAALAAIIETAAYCAAAPGHTAQPFQPTRTAKPFLLEAWKRDPVMRTGLVFKTICAQHARLTGSAVVSDALDTAKSLRPGDLAFIDPPYSGVQYSRFYHVLETIATGYAEQVTGTGRYPHAAARPQSDFSLVSKSAEALDNLLREIAVRGANAILTFPDHECSNGLSGAEVSQIAANYFVVNRRVVSSRFSSLGGTSGASAAGSERAAQRQTKELILHLRSKRRFRKSVAPSTPGRGRA